MKLKQLVTGGALAAMVLTLGSAQAEENRYDGIVFCKAQVVSLGDSADNLSIALRFNSKLVTPAGEECAYWNLGSVAAGGVADSWHSEGGPGRFCAHNNGGMSAYVYLTSASERYDRFGRDYVKVDDVYYKREEFASACNIMPSPSLRYLKNRSQSDNELAYCLAFSRDVQAKIPTWHMLNRYLKNGDGKYNDQMNSQWRMGDDFRYGEDVNCIGAYMGHLDSGEYMEFDVKFWAPLVPQEWENRRREGQVNWPYKSNVRFTFMVEAAPFPLWEHDADVQ